MMTKRIKLQGLPVRFPNTCVVCLQPAQHTYTIDKTYTLGPRTITVALPVPLCAQHYAHTQAKSPAERLVERLGLWVGAAVGLLVVAGLLIYWYSTGESMSFVNVTVAAFVGVGFFLIVWAATAYWFAPSFALPESKAARAAVRVTRYWKAQNIIELEFDNELAADRVAYENRARLLP